MVATVSEKSSYPDNSAWYYCAYLVEPRQVGDRSNHTPQHLTLSPPTPANEADVLQAASETAKRFDPFEIALGEHAMFGPNEDIPVMVIEPNFILQALHKILISKLEEKGILFKDNRYIGDRYAPHIALKRYHPNISGDRLLIDHIAVMRKDDDIKTVLAKEPLGKPR
jgi:2'-5' RNA ligase